MYFERLFGNKKAQEGEETEVPKSARGLLLGGMLVLVIAGIFLNSSKLFAAEGGEGTAESFGRFVDGLRAVASGEKNVSIIENMAIGDKDYLFAVFDSRPFLEDTCDGNEKFWKPEQCGNKICACVCHEDYACQNPIECRIIENSTRGEVASEIYPEFNANLGKTYDANAKKAYALIYGNCDGWGTKPLGIRDIVIQADPNDKNLIRISDNACGNKKIAGRSGKCTISINDTARCVRGESPLNDPSFVCERGFTCCI